MLFPERDSVRVRKTTFRGQTIFHLSLQDAKLFTPAWCISDKYLIVSLSPQNIRAFLARDPSASSLADLPCVAARFKSDRTTWLLYQDTAATLRVTYPLLQMMVAEWTSECSEEGFDLDAALLPSLASLLRHVEPSVSTLVRDKDGLVYVSRESLPVGSLAIPISAIILNFVVEGPIVPAY